LSASVDSDLIGAAENAVARGHYESVSAWVNEALRLKLDHERRLNALAGFVAAYEDRHGEITPEEMRLAARRARAGAINVRGTPKANARPGRRPARDR
jgi:Arc/MetJ-type ribon-helix-helix transcriptional regulator